VLGLVVRSGSRDRRGLGLGAQTCKEVRATGARGWVIDCVLVDGTDLGREGDAQPLRVEARSTRAEAGGRGIEPGRKAVIVVVVKSHLSETTSVHALIWDRIKLGIRLKYRKCKSGNMAVSAVLARSGRMLSCQGELVTESGAGDAVTRSRLCPWSGYRD
jgi:hypothetical protein